MTWTKVAATAFSALLVVVGWAFAAGNTWSSQAVLPGRVDKVEERLQRVENSQNRVEGKVDTVIGLLKGRK